MSNGSSRKELAEYADRERQRYETALADSVQIPSVSVDPDHKADVAREAEFAAGLIRSLGGQAEIHPTAGHPLVYGRFDRGENLPTVTVYNHLDVQPAESDDWKTRPFEFTRQGNRYFGRGTTDDKGPAMTALFGARYVWEKDIPLNIRLLWEHEEEIGSPHFESTIKKHAREFATDSVVVSDTVWVSRARPAQPAGLRGLQGLRFELQTGQTEPHSCTA